MKLSTLYSKCSCLRKNVNLSLNMQLRNSIRNRRRKEHLLEIILQNRENVEYGTILVKVKHMKLPLKNGWLKPSVNGKTRKIMQVHYRNYSILSVVSLNG